MSSCWYMGESCNNPLLPMRAKFGVLEQGLHLRAKFRLDRFILSPSVDENPQFLRFFRLPHLVLSPNGNSLIKLNTGAQLQTFHYPTASKSFLYSNAFIAKSGAQSLTSKSMTNKQTDKKCSTFLFWPHGGGWNLSPTKHGTVIEDLEHVLAPLKLLGVWCTVSLLGGTENKSISPRANVTKF